MRLLVSPKNRGEAIEAVNGGADIIDVKNPAEGSLGANFPWVINDIKGIIPDGIELSATLGDFPYLPGTASLAARGVASLGVDYIKIGLYGVKSLDQGLRMGEAVVKSVREYNADIKVVIAGYADYSYIGSVKPGIILEVVERCGADVFMLDTALKTNGNLFSYISRYDLGRLVERAHRGGILAAVGGSMGKGDVETLIDLCMDVVGVRGAVCEGNDRLGGEMRAGNVRILRDVIDGGGHI